MTIETEVINDIEWLTSSPLVPFPEAVEFMEQRVADVYHGSKRETIWLLEHDSIYTAGTSAKKTDLLNRSCFPVYSTGRGGQYTYHGPGQRITYVMLDLRKRGSDIRLFVNNLSLWVIKALAEFGIQGKFHDDRIGIWVRDQNNIEKKIAAIGIRIRRWITFHGISINVKPNLKHYRGIIPCGLSEFGITSFNELGIDINLREFDEALKRTFGTIF